MPSLSEIVRQASALSFCAIAFFATDTEAIDVRRESASLQSWVKIGAQLRFRGEYRDNYDLTSRSTSLPGNAEFILGRFRLWASLTPSPSLHAFLELQSLWVWESEHIVSYSAIATVRLLTVFDKSKGALAHPYSKRNHLSPESIRAKKPGRRTG